MSYQEELDDVRCEVRRGASAQPVRRWPKVYGSNVVASASTWIAFGPTGTQIASGSSTIDSIGGVSRLTASVDASVLALGEGYRVEFTYTSGALSYVEASAFDVVVEPTSVHQLGISLNDFVAEQSDVERILAAQAVLQSAERTSAQQAAVLGARAWADVRGWLRKRVASELTSDWPRYLCDQEEVRNVVVARALARMWVAQGVSSADAREQADWWRDEAERRFAALPPLRFSIDHDRTADAGATLGSPSVVRVSRTW